VVRVPVAVDCELEEDEEELWLDDEEEVEPGRETEVFPGVGLARAELLVASCAVS